MRSAVGTLNLLEYRAMWDMKFWPHQRRSLIAVPAAFRVATHYRCLDLLPYLPDSRNKPRFRRDGKKPSAVPTAATLAAIWLAMPIAQIGWL